MQVALAVDLCDCNDNVAHRVDGNAHPECLAFASAERIDF